MRKIKRVNVHRLDEDVGLWDKVNMLCEVVKELARAVDEDFGEIERNKEE